MLTRRGILQDLLGLNGVALTMSMAAGKKKRPEKPTRLKRGQVWRTSDGWTCYVAYAQARVELHWFGPTEEHGSSTAFYHPSNAILAKCMRDHWTYVGSLSDLGASHE